ncbi:MAG: hypothetical protein HY092_01790 [Candidatus Kerfeldbacteria bacterium]|nr:hypothetical protein [Candidatus Kerfeldbacteria bacterium]
MTLVTHKKPHLDEVVASWLLHAFDPKFSDCDFQFVAYTPTGGVVPPGPEYVALGVGRGQYDEHGLKAGHSCTQLVYEDLMHRGLIPNDQFEDKAIEWLVDYAHKEDTGQWELTDPNYTSFSIPAILRGVWLTTKKDQAIIDQGWSIIDAVMAQLNERAKFLADWDKRIEFDSKWGKAVAVHSTYRAADVFAYHHGFVLRVQSDPTKPFGDFRGDAKSQVDLTPIYELVNAKEPGSWYLHQSKKILTSNIDPLTGLKPTKYHLQQLIDLVKV